MTTPGARQWAFQAGRTVSSSPALSPDGSTVFCGSNDNHLYAINAANGAQKWAFETGGGVPSSPCLSRDASLVFVGSNDNNLYAITAAMGVQRWAFSTGGGVPSSPALSPDGLTVFVGSNDNHLYAVDAGTGVRRWAFEAGSAVHSSPALSPDGSTVFVGSYDQYLYAINAATGTQRWAFQAGDGVHSSPVLSPDGMTVFVGSSDQHLYAIDAATGNQRWAFEAGSYVNSSPALSPDGLTVFVGSSDQHLYAIDAASGARRWAFEAGGAVYSSPALSPDGSTVLVGSDDKHLYAIDATTGDQRWAFRAGGGVDSSPTLSQDGSIVFVGSRDKHLCAIETGLATGSPPAAGTSAVRLPRDATLQQVVDAHDERVSRVEQAKSALVAREDAKCAVTRRGIAALQAKLGDQERLLALKAAEFDRELEAAHAEAAEAADAARLFPTRVATTGLEGLSIEDVYQLLHLLQVPVAKSVLEDQDISGITLVGLTEPEMEEVLGMVKLGDRRRLSMKLQRLANQQGFAAEADPMAPGALGWGPGQVCEWLAAQGLQKHSSDFRDQHIDGPVLLELTRDDLKHLGVDTLGDRAQLIQKLSAVKKQTYAGLVVGGDAAATPAASVPTLSEDQRRLVLEQVLEENAALQEQLAQRHPRRDEMPNHFMCPITNGVMEDPVVAMDGFTYERSAIATWFQRHNTSPMTRAVIPPTLVPNVGKRSEIANWDCSTRKRITSRSSLP